MRCNHVDNAESPRKVESFRNTCIKASCVRSSASAVLLELVHNRHAPAALVMHEPDAILLLGLIVARQMGWPTPVALRLPRDGFETYRGRIVGVAESGALRTTA